MIRNEIKDWFKKLVNTTFGPDISIRYLKNDAHFNIHTYVEISGTESQIIEAVEFIRNTSEIVKYKMPWLNGNMYYVLDANEKEIVERKLKTIKDINYDMKYMYTRYSMIGVGCTIFHFRPDLDDTKKIEIDEIFKSLANVAPLFITYPKTRALHKQSSVAMATNILTAFHGKFLNYLSFEDIFSLEMANKEQESSFDMDLDHDIQMFLQNRYPELYGGAKIDDGNLKEFRINDVLHYFIHKYHDRFTKCAIPNILTANEIQSLSRTYNIELVHHNTTHIDFKSTLELEIVNFCAICHYDPTYSFFLNYDPKYATQNYTITFHDDDSLDPLNSSNEFSHFVIKSQNNCSPQKTNAVLKYLTDSFKVCPNGSLMLYTFDLSQVSRQTLSSLLNTMRLGWLDFDKMNFDLKTLIAILSESDHNRMVFRKCHIAIENVEPISNNFKIRGLWFYDMDIDLNLLSILRNIGRLEFRNCRLLSTSWEISTKLQISDQIWFQHTSFDAATLQSLLNGLQHVQKVNFLSCDLMPCKLFENRYFTIQNIIRFANMVFKIQTLFQILESCEIQNRLIFDNCHFRLEYTESSICSLRPVKVQFDHTKFEVSTLLTILETLNSESKVWIGSSRILPVGYEKADISNKFILLEYIELFNCRIERQTLLNILGRMSKKTEVLINNCDIMYSAVVYPHILVKLSKIVFWNMKLHVSDLFAVLGILKTNSSVAFTGCEIAAENEELPKINLQREIEIHFSNMTIASQIAQSILQFNSWIFFNNCCLEFMTDAYSNISIQSHVTFRNMTFDLSAHIKALAHCFTAKSKIEFQNCHFESRNSVIPNTEIKPLWISFERTTFDLEVLITVMELISEQTEVYFKQCDIQSTQLFSIKPIKIRTLGFENMSLEISTILYILKNFTNLYHLRFDYCNILCTNPNVLSNVKLKPKFVMFMDMDIDVRVFQIFMQNCVTGLIVVLDNCKMKPARNNMLLSNALLEIENLILMNVNYSPELLQILQYLNGESIVEYHGQLSNRAIVEICTKTEVHGERLRLVTQICTKSIYFELFAEFFRPIALNYEPDTEAEYDLPTYLIPNISSLPCDSEYDWNAFKIKFVLINDVSMKLEFLRNGIVLDLFYELNDLPDDSDESVVDYY